MFLARPHDTHPGVVILWEVQDSGLAGEVSRGEKMALRGTDPESYITEYTLVHEY